jgi:hypothetical protein
MGHLWKRSTGFGLRQNQVESQLRQQAHNLELPVNTKTSPDLDVFIIRQVNGLGHWIPPENKLVQELLDSIIAHSPGWLCCATIYLQGIQEGNDLAQAIQIQQRQPLLQPFDFC